MGAAGKDATPENGLPPGASVGDITAAPDIARLLQSNPSIADGRVEVLVWDEAKAAKQLAARTAAHKRVKDADRLRVLHQVPPLTKCHALAAKFECLQVHCHRWCACHSAHSHCCVAPA